MAGSESDRRSTLERDVALKGRESMEILVNGQSGLASAPDDAPLGEVFQHLRVEFAKQRLVVRTFVVDGEEVFPDDNEELCAKTAADIGKLEIQLATLEAVAHDVLDELSEKMPALSAQAVTVTEKLQTGESGVAGEDLQRFVNSVAYVIEALSNIQQLLSIDFSKYDTDEHKVAEEFESLTSQLNDLNEAVKYKDVATIGDVLEFDIAPKVEFFGQVMQKLRDDIRTKVEAEVEAEGGA